MMRDTVGKGFVQKMNNSRGVPKGMARVLTERGIDVSRMKAEDIYEGHSC